MSRRTRLLAGVGLALLTLWACAGWAGAGYAMRPPWYRGVQPDGKLPAVDTEAFGGVTSDPREAFGIGFEDVAFAAEDGQTLRGWFGPGRPAAAPPRAAHHAVSGERAAGPVDSGASALLLVHGGGGDRRDYLRHVPIFHDAGWPVLLFDCREHGASDGHGVGISFGAREHRDVSSAVAWLRGERGFERVGVLGTSQGGASVILAAARDPGIDAVIAENPFSDLDALLASGGAGMPAPLRWTLTAFLRLRTYGSTPEPLDVVAKIAPRPLLLLHGSADSIVDAGQSESLYAAAGEPRELWIAPGAEHTRSYDEHPVEYSRRVLAFFEPLRSGPR